MKKLIISILILFAFGFTSNHLQAQNNQSVKTGIDEIIPDGKIGKYVVINE